MKRKVLSILLCAAVAFTAVVSVNTVNTQKANAASKEVRGMWIAFCDFSSLGLKNKSEKTFTANLDKALNKAKYDGCNTIYWHARAFDDATWESKTFKASKYLSSKASSSKTAASTYSYDPLGIAVRECKERGLKIEAWLNPYRITYGTFLDPSSTNSTARINRAVDELQGYGLNGIHFDDYFYHSSSRYRSPSSSAKYSISVKGSDTKKKPSASKKRSYVNKMIKSVYSNVHKKSGWKFGISPAGNVENCMASGADVSTWMKSAGYIDYIAPQIYWTDNWGSRGKTKMFSKRLAQWKNLNKRNVDMYIGLALYRTGKKASDDKGWGKRKTNMRTQVKTLRSKGMEGYILFEASDLYRSGAKTELYKLQGLVNPIPAKSLKFKSSSKAWVGKGISTKLSWNPSDTNPKSVKYSSSNTKVATVSSSGTVTGRAPGTAVITATAKSGKKAKLTKNVRSCRVKVKKLYITSRKGPGSKYSKSTKYVKWKRLTITRSKGKWGKIKGKNKWVYMPYTTRLSK